MLRLTLLFSAILAVLAGCAKKEEIFEGQRFDVRTALSDTIPSDEFVDDAAGSLNLEVAIKLPKQQNSNSWTHRNGSPAHRIVHPALGTQLTRLWSASIGAGNGRKQRISSDPIVAGGRIFTMDSQSQVRAISPIGAVLWQKSLTPQSDKVEEASSGGLAFGDGLLFATTGFGELTAINPEDGSTVWQQTMDASIAAPPVVSGGRVYVISRDNQAWALDTKNGRIKWQQQSSRSDTGLVGGAAPAIAGKLVLLPFGSGEMVAALTRNGVRIWSVAVSGSRRGQARSNIGDITSDPVVSGGRVYAANQSGRVVAVERRTGERIWTANEGAYSPVWPVGGSVFLVSDAAQIVRLDARNGEVIWAVDLPKFKKEKTRKDSFTHFGPILAGGRLLVASSDGLLRSFDPVSGALVSTVEIPSGAASQPAIVDGVLYILSQNGELHAFK